MVNLSELEPGKVKPPYGCFYAVAVIVYAALFSIGVMPSRRIEHFPGNFMLCAVLALIVARNSSGLHRRIAQVAVVVAMAFLVITSVLNM